MTKRGAEGAVSLGRWTKVKNPLLSVNQGMSLVLFCSECRQGVEEGAYTLDYLVIIHKIVIAFSYYCILVTIQLS